jgi:large repetitive protein
MDFKNSDIHSAPVITDLNGTEAAAALDAAATVAVAMQAGNILPLTADGQLVLPAGVGLDDIKVVGRDLVIQMPDGTQMIVPDGAVFVPEIVVEGVAVPPLNIAALLIGQEPQPAAGRPQSSGGNFADAVGDIGDPFGLGDLLPPTQLAFPGPEEPEIIPYLVDRDPDVVIQDGGPISRDVVDNVSEVGLPGTRSNGNVESPGSSTGNGADSTTGTIFVTSPDGIASITINGVIVTGTAGQQIVTARGVLTLGALSDGQIGYTYRLTDNTSGDATSDPFTVVVTDLDGDVASARLTINIADDSPTARNDTDSVPAASYIGQTGNVITGVGTTSGNAGADTQGADGAVLSGIRAGDSAGSFAAAGTTINGQYGTLTIAANGSYTYTRNAGTPGGVNDVFTYQLTDGDGDTSTATLTISIADSPVTITSVPTTGAGTVVDEAGLPARGTEPPGSNAAAPSESTSGTITFTAPDGVASVAINGIAITGAGQVITVSTGTLLITGYNPATGTLAYTFTLTDNTSGDATSQIFTITVTDTDGDTASSPFTVRIIDDVPTARNDSGTQAAENIPVTVNIIANDTQGADGVNLSTGVALVAGSLTGTGTLVYNNNGTFTYTPAPGEQGVVTFNYTITDSDGDVSTATVTINLLEDSTPSLRVAGDNDERGRTRGFGFGSAKRNRCWHHHCSHRWRQHCFAGH